MALPYAEIVPHSPKESVATKAQCSKCVKGFGRHEEVRTRRAAREGASVIAQAAVMISIFPLLQHVICRAITLASGVC